MTTFSQANNLLRSGNPAQAIPLYLQALRATPDLSRIILPGIVLARKRYLAARKGHKPKVAVCGWELAHNSAGRAYNLAQMYATFADAEIIGAYFPQLGRDIWPPLRNAAIPLHSFVSEDQTRFVDQALELVLSHPYDVVHLSKPRMPNILFGLLYKLSWGSTVLMDIDDEELAFVDAQAPLTLEAYLQKHGRLPELTSLDGTEWTQLSVGLATAFDGITVSNPALQKRYGGQIIRHARDENFFQFSLELRDQSRKKFKILPDKKVILFCGTPREHNGLLETARAIAGLERKDVIFAVLGDFPDPALKQKLQEIKNIEYLFIGNQPVASIPEVTALGDVCVLFQEPGDRVSNFQIPAKLSDALAMGQSVILQDLPPLADVIQSGAFLQIKDKNALPQALEQALAQPSSDQPNAKARDLFLKEFSFAANTPRLRQTLQTARSIPGPLNTLQPLLQHIPPLLPYSSLASQQSKTESADIKHQRTENAVSIIILTRNAAQDLDNCLNSFLKTNTHKPVELIIIDLASTDKTADIVVKHKSKSDIQYFRCDRHYTFAESCNFGATKARYPNLLFLSNDIIYTADVLPRAVEHMTQNTQTGAVGFRLDDDPACLPKGAPQGVQHSGIKFRWNEEHGYHEPEQISHPSLKEFLSSPTTYSLQLTTAVTAAAMLVRQSNFQSLKGLSSKYTCGLEEIDFCLRLGRDLQKKCYCINDMGLQHVEGATRKDLYKDKSDIIENNHAMFKKEWNEYISNKLQVQKHSQTHDKPIYKPLSFLPNANVECLSEDEYAWCATSDDPSFTVELVGSLLKKPGWYTLRIHLKTSLSKIRAKFYFDTGKGANEKESLILSGNDDAVIKRIFYAEKPVKKLRFDPMEKAEKFTIKHISLCKRDEARAKKYMLDILLQSDKYKSVKEKSILENMLSKLGKDKYSSIMSTIYSEYNRLYPSMSDFDANYLKWIASNDTITIHDRSLIKHHISSFNSRPKFSILMPVYNTRPQFLREAIDSVSSQIYQDWELCIVDDNSTIEDVSEILLGFSAQDSRIKTSFRKENGGISACTNTALDMATGDWIVLMDHDDILPEYALYMVAEAINTHPDVSILYSDEDRMDENGKRFKPYFKPSFNYDLFLGQNMINHLGVYRADLVQRAGGFREGFEGSQDWDLALRVMDVASNPRIHHIPFILYHWRSGGERFSTQSTIRTREASERAVNEHFRRTGQAAEAIPLQISSFLRIKRELPSVRPLVSIIIPTQNFDDRFKTCIDGLLNRTSYSPMEIIVADNGSNEQNVPLYDELRSHQFVNIIKAPEPFNFSKLVNKAASASSGEILVLLHKDTKITNSEWLNEMVCHVLRSDVGAVGAKLCDESDTIQHAGVVFKNHNDGDSIDEHIHRGVPRSFSGYFHRLIFTHEVACVTKVCLATRREVFMELGGFDENNLSVFFNDIHFCFQARQAGYRIIWTPHAELYHYNDQANQVSFSNSEQYSSIYKAEHAYMRKIWGKELDEDPFYNPNLSLHNAEFNISHKPRTKKPWLEFAASLWNLDQSHNLTSDITEAMLEASQQRMNDSVADRLGRVDKYKKDIEAYASARCGRSEAHNTEKIAIYAAISGDYDSIKMPAHLDDRFDYILFTDTPAPSTGVWQIRPFPDFDLDLTRRARYIKTHPHRLLNGYDIAIWIDANIMILGDIYPLIQDFILSDKSVAAVFHPLRNSLYDEFNACIKYKIDDVSRMENQLNRYKNIGFMSDELIESNVMMFKLTDTKVDLFLDTWWSEIESYSKRDQLSLNFALAHHGLKWHQLAKPPNSIRNHPLFAMVCHDKKQSPAQQLVDVLTTATEESKIFAGDQHLIAPENVAQPTGIDIIVPVYNALGDVQLCLSSLEKFTDGFDVSIIVVNDGSDEATTQWLRDWCKDKQLYNLIEQPSNQGYTKSVNLGLKISTAPYVITQNSDTIVTAGWLKKMVACIESDPDLGVVGPLSNAASWQNVPVLKDESGNFAVNQLPLGLDVDSMAIIVAEVSERRYPRIRFVNGFCFLMRRSVLTTIGYMDEVNFPKGYGEENDFCMRLSDAGFKMAIADDVFIYHAKSKSFGHDFRVALSKQGGDALIKKHGKDKVHGAVDQTKKAAKLLDPLRMKLDQLLYQTNEVASTKETTDTKHNIKPIIKPPPVFGTREYQKDAPFSGPILTLPLEKVDKSNNTDWPFSIGIHLHLYYLDLLEEFSDYLSNIPAKFTLYVSVVDAACVQNVQAHFEKALKSCTLVVKVFENKGRDIAAFIAGFGKELSQHDIICHIHSKRSLHNQAKRDWRRQLLHNLMGSRTYVDELFSLFVKNKHIGMVFPEFHWSLKEQISWGTNFSVCQKVANRIGIDINEFILPLFPAGSMFWARSKALRQLLQAGINYADFPNEDKQIDGTFAHAVERLFGAIVQENNFDLMQVRAEKPHKMKSNTTDSNVGGRKELSHEKA